MKKAFLIFSLLSLLLPAVSQAAPAEKRLRGRILLQVESHGEAWYVRPQDGTRVYMKDGDVAYDIMREFSLGISNTDLAKIPVGFHDGYGTYDADNDSDGLLNKTEEAVGTDMNKADSDGDGFNDRDELERGYNPLGSNKLNYDNTLVSRFKGYILLQVQNRGQAWYINPVDGKRYFMANGLVAYQMMRYMSLGITNADLVKINNYGEIVENNIFTLSNIKAGDTFGSMKVVSVGPYTSGSVMSEDNYKIKFAGNIFVSGTYTRHDEGILSGQICMGNLDKEFLAKIPKASTDTRSVWFCFDNLADAQDRFTQVGSGRTTVMISNYTINSVPAEVFNTATLLTGYLGINEFLINRFHI